MATSRYGNDSGTSTPSNATTTTENSGSTNTTGPSTIVTGSTGSSTRDSSSSSRTTNMSPQNLAALDALIAQLLNGGTANQKQDRATKYGEIVELKRQRQGYSKEAAFADAKGLMAQQSRLTLEKLLPSINSASLGAGASSSSMRALLTQRAAENAAENASAAGLGAAVNYGQVSNGMSSVLANLIAQQDPVAMALVNALSVAKGSVTNTKTTGTETTNSSGTQVQNNSGSTNTTGPSTNTSTVSYAPAAMSSGSLMNVPSFAPVTYGNPQSDLDLAIENLRFTGTSSDNMRQLWGNDNAWSGYTFQ